MKYLSIQEAIKKGKGKVSIRGWVYRERGSNKLKFITLRDSTNIIQCVLERTNFEKTWEEIDSTKIETSMELHGTIKKDERAPTGYEIQVTDYRVVGTSDNFPIGKDFSTGFLSDNRHLWLRSRKMVAIMKIRSTVFGALHEYFRGLDYHEFQSPIIIPGGAEEGPTLFEIKYYKDVAFLCQTWQLYAEAAMFGLEKIYTISPSFRAEKSSTSRHLCEYWHAEMEVAWTDLPELMDLAEGMVKLCFKRVLEKNQLELEILKRDPKVLEPVIKKPFPRVTYTKVLEDLKKKKMKVEWGKDLRTLEEEKFMDGKDVPAFVTNYPKEEMAFYKPRDPKDKKTALCFDLLGPEKMGEIIGGSVRDENIEELKASLKAAGEDVDNYKYYLDTRKYGSVPHAGFGMGVERIVRWICGLETIKDAIAFPRTMDRFKP